MDYETGMRLDELLRQLQDITVQQQVVLRVLQVAYPEQYNSVYKELQKAQKQ